MNPGNGYYEPDPPLLPTTAARSRLSPRLHEADKRCDLIGGMLYRAVLGHRMLARADQLAYMVDKLHCGTSPDTFLVTMKERSHPVEKGLFYYDPEWEEEPRIYIDPDGSQPSLTMAHEVGHFLEVCLINARGTKTLKRNLFKPWWTAVRRSMPYNYLYAALQNGVLFARNSDAEPGWRKASEEQMGHVRYLLRPEELWARSYAQYIATSHKTTRTYAELVAIQNSDDGQTYQIQWEPEDFAPICREIHGILDRLEWLHAIKCGC